MANDASAMNAKSIEALTGAVLARLPDRFARTSRGQWELPRSDISWRVTVDRDENWSSGQGRVWVGVLVPQVYGILPDLMPIRTSKGDIAYNLLKLAGGRGTEWRSRFGVTPKPRTWSLSQFLDGERQVTSEEYEALLADLLAKVAMPWFSRFNSSYDVGNVLISERKSLEAAHAVGYPLEIAASILWLRGDRDTARAILRMDATEKRPPEKRRAVERLREDLLRRLDDSK